jgi:hypothetical protein
MGFEYYRCPNTKRIIVLTPGDDKALCSCGKRNPKVPTEAIGHHVVKTGINRSIVLLEQVTLKQAILEG